jgi:hypothetical protein
MKQSSKMLHLEHTLYGAERWTLWRVDQKYVERFVSGAGEEWRSFGPIM